MLIQAGAGEGSAIADADYEAQGARIAARRPRTSSPRRRWCSGSRSPSRRRSSCCGEGQTLFTYLHLAPAPELTKALCDSGATCVAYETVEDAQGRLPLLAPMSEVAGKIATQAGAFMLEKPLGGRGILLGGVPGVAAANVMVIGGGAVGMNAAFIAIGMEADVFVYDVSIDKLRELDVAFGGRASTVFSSTLSIEERLPDMDLVIGGVLVHGARAPHVITRKQLALMKRHAVLVDVAIDQGGCFETSRPTTHGDPTYEVDGIIHYCVTNMPGAVPITSTYALTNATLPYVLALADHGVAEAARRDPRPEARGQRRRREGHPPGGRRGRRHGVRRARAGARHRARPRRGPRRRRRRGHGIARGPQRPVTTDTTTTTSERRNLMATVTGTEAPELHRRRVRRSQRRRTEDVINPSTGEVIAQAPLSTRRGRRSRGRGGAQGVRDLGGQYARARARRCC